VFESSLSSNSLGVWFKNCVWSCFVIRSRKVKYDEKKNKID
jgi:hypothetical protein